MADSTEEAVDQQQQPRILRAQCRIHGIIKGKVQGVFFRKHTQAEAQRLGVTGWVRNLPTGEVEVVGEGSEEQCGGLEQWLKHTGSPKSRIDEAHVTRSKPSDEFSSFDILKGR